MEGRKKGALRYSRVKAAFFHSLSTQDQVKKRLGSPGLTLQWSYQVAFSFSLLQMEPDALCECVHVLNAMLNEILKKLALPRVVVEDRAGLFVMIPKSGRRDFHRVVWPPFKQCATITITIQFLLWEKVHLRSEAS